MQLPGIGIPYNLTDTGDKTMIRNRRKPFNNITLAFIASLKPNTDRKVLTRSTLAMGIVLTALATLSACNDDDDPSSPPRNHYDPIHLSIAHINDSHSHLEPLAELEFQINSQQYRAQLGGFPRIKTVFDELADQYANDNLIKLHAGDALTGTSYFSFYKGKADADMMNAICFDAFALGNHEFDESDEGLKSFLDYFKNDQCQTEVLAANVKAKVGTPLAPTKSDDYIKPYLIKTTKEGVKVGIIGIDIAGKTKKSSRPLATTEFLDETTTAQNYINELKNQGIEHIVLLTHYTYSNDQKLAAELSGVDVIIGGDSHTLLGDFTPYGKSAADNFGSQGPYPTVVKNKEGHTVCIGQSWEYTKAVGIMDISFDQSGNVTSCVGSQILPIAKTIEKYNQATDKFEALASDENTRLIEQLLASKADLLKQDLILPYDEDAAVANILAEYTAKISENMSKVIGQANETLCLVRVPGTTRSANIAGCEDTANHARGSDIAQVVAKAFLDAALRADFALQNAGGVRETVITGDISYKTAYTLLPFSNTLVNLEITGQQVKDTLEDAIANHMDEEGSSGSHPYADGLRWDLDLTQSKGNRVRNIEVRNRKTGVWSALDRNKTYVMATNDYIAEGRDGYLTLAKIFKDSSKVDDTKLLYTQSFIDYIEKIGTVSRPGRNDYSHKSVITKEGKLLAP